MKDTRQHCPKDPKDHVRGSRVSKNDKRRGRPPVGWTLSRESRLLSLYLFTPAKELSVDDIRNLITDGSFAPSKRAAQCKLKELLSKSYSKLRPANRAQMRKRVQFLGLIRSKRSMKNYPHLNKSEFRNQWVAANNEIIDVNQNYCWCRTNFQSPGGYIPNSSPINFPVQEQLPPNRSYTTPPLPVAPGISIASQKLSLSLRADTLTETMAEHLSGSILLLPKASHIENIEGPAPQLPRRSTISLVRKVLGDRRRSSFLEDLARILSWLSFRSGPLSPLSTRTSWSDRMFSLIGRREEEPPTPQGANTPIRVSSTCETQLPDDHNANEVLISCCCRHTCTWPPGICIHRRICDSINQIKNLGNSSTSLDIIPLEANAVDSLGNSLLHVAARWQALGVLSEIIDATANVNITNQAGQTFLHVLSPSSESSIMPTEFAEFLKKLKSRNFNFNIFDVNGRSCLHALVLNPKFPPESLEAFFETVDVPLVGGLVQRLDCKGESLVHCIRGKARRLQAEDQWDQAYLCDYLIERYCTKATATPAVLLEEPFRLAVDHREISTSRTPLMTLLQRLHGGSHTDDTVEEYVRRMVEAGAALELCDYRGNTALHYAAALGLSSAIKILIAHGADISAQNKSPYTPLDMVVAKLKRRTRPQRLQAAKLVARYLECAVLLLDAPSAAADSHSFEHVRTYFGITGEDTVPCESYSMLPQQVQCYLHHLAPLAHAPLTISSTVGPVVWSIPSFQP